MKKDIIKITIAFILFIISIIIPFSQPYINVILYIASYVIVRVRNNSNSHKKYF